MTAMDIGKHEDINCSEVERPGDESPVTWTPEEEKKLVRKIDLFLMPTIWIMYLLSYMVRTPSTN